MTGSFLNCGGDQAINNLNGGTWNWSGTVYPAGLDLYCDNAINTFNYNGGGNQDIITPRDAYWNLDLSVSGIKEAQGDLDINGDLAIGGGVTFNVATNSSDIAIAGDWSDNGTFVEGTRQVVFDGSDAQEISSVGGETFYDLETNHSGTGITLASEDVTVSNILTMTQGNIITGPNMITLGTGTGNEGTLVHSSGTIVGDFQRWINTTSADYLFPVGTTSNYRRATIRFNT